MKGELRFLVGSRPRLRDFFGVSSLSHGFARVILCYSAMERRIRDFFGVSSLSHGFARALPYSAMEIRIEILGCHF